MSRRGRWQPKGPEEEIDFNAEIAEQKGREFSAFSAGSALNSAVSSRAHRSPTPAGRRPANARESPHAAAPDDDPFRHEEIALQERTSAEAAKAPACGDDAMTGDVRMRAVAHDVADRAGRPRPSSQGRDVTVGRHPAGRDLSDDGKDAAGEAGRKRQNISDFVI